MDKKLFIIAIAVGGAVITTLLSVYLQMNEPNPRTKRILRVTLAAGVAALIVMCVILLSR
jgi:uncharacterized membrane protein